MGDKQGSDVQAGRDSGLASGQHLPLLNEDVRKTINLMLDKGLCEQSRAVELAREIAEIVSTSG